MHRIALLTLSQAIILAGALCAAAPYQLAAQTYKIVRTDSSADKPQRQAVLKRTAQQALFLGLGGADRGDPTVSDAMPWSIGYFYQGANSKVYWGIDIAGEGTLLDNTSGNFDVVEQGISFNLLVGRSFRASSHWRVGGGLLAGGRSTDRYCPDSYLGYECYADEDPTVEYDFNVGAMIHVAFKNAIVGYRLSGASAQYMFGIAF